MFRRAMNDLANELLWPGILSHQKSTCYETQVPRSLRLDETPSCDHFSSGLGKKPPNAHNSLSNLLPATSYHSPTSDSSLSLRLFSWHPRRCVPSKSDVWRRFPGPMFSFLLFLSPCNDDHDQVKFFFQFNKRCVSNWGRGRNVLDMLLSSNDFTRKT